MQVLIVDDQSYSRSFMREFVKEMGLSCRVAESIKEAKRLLGSEQFDGILCDYHLGPGEFASDLIRESGLPGVIATADPHSAKLDLSRGDLVVFSKGELYQACEFLISLIEANKNVMVEPTPQIG